MGEEDAILGYERNAAAKRRRNALLQFFNLILTAEAMGMFSRR